MPRPKTDSTRVNVYLPNQYIRAGKALAKRRGISFSELMRNAIASYVRAEALKETSNG